MSNDDFAVSRVGTTLNQKYRLDRLLGCGGMAAVYAATHRNRNAVAIKILHPELSARDDIRERFLREGYVANTVDHPGAVAVLDDDVDEEGTPYLVMELLQGSSLETLADQLGGSLPLVTLFRVGEQLLSVLQAAHSKGVVHRDIKPDNLFLSAAGQLKVLDFGIARLREPTDANVTRTGLMMGTPGYMPPEQALGDTKSIDARTDLWAVGATLFRLLTGELPGGDSSTMDLYRFAMEGARPVLQVLPTAPKPLAEVIDRALAQKREDRWPSAAAMGDALTAAHRAIFNETVMDGERTPNGTLLSTQSGPPGEPQAEPESVSTSSDVGAAPTLQSASEDAPHARPSDPRTAPPVEREGKPRPGALGGFALGVAAVFLAGGLYVLGRNSALPATAADEPAAAATGQEPPPVAATAGNSEGASVTVAASDSGGATAATSAQRQAEGAPALVDAGASSVETAPKATARTRPTTKPRPRPRPATRALSERCVRLLKRATLGETLTPAETNTLTRECR